MSKGIRVGFQFFLLFRLFSRRFSPSGFLLSRFVGSQRLLGGGMGRKAEGDATPRCGAGRGVQRGSLARGFLCLSLHSFIACSLPVGLQPFLMHIFFFCVQRAWYEHPQNRSL